MSEDPVERLVKELAQTIADSETADDEDILDAVANVLAHLARMCGVSAETLLTNLGVMMGATDVHVKRVRVVDKDDVS